MITPRQDRIVKLGVLATAAAYLLAQGYNVNLGAKMYGLLVNDMSKTDVRYVMGSPAAGSTDSEWQYPVATGVTSYVRFADGGDRASTFGCKTVETHGGCPPTLGLSTGSTEDQMLYRLGNPTQSVYSNGAKIVTYRSLGLRFTLRQFVIIEIQHFTPAGRFDFLEKVPRIAIP